MIGKTLSHYEILELLGKGGMGEVYRAKDTRLGREVALKVLPVDLAQDRDRVARFEREARAVSSLKHRNIIHLYDVGREGDLAFYSMELVDGVTLQERMKSDPMAQEEWTRIAEQMAGAIGAAHMQGVVHRDLKPANILLDEDGEVKILDFGLAKLLQPNDQIGDAPTELQTQPEVVLGTVAYMSPEQAIGRPAERTSDLFSLGIILYQMATGQHPFAAESSTEIMAKILSEAPPVPSTDEGALDPSVSAILEKCLEKDPTHRYQSAGELQVDLKRLHATDGSSGRGFAEAPPAKQRNWLPIAAIVLVLIVAGYFLSFLKSSSDAQEVGSIAILPFENGTSDPETGYLCDGLSESLIHNLSELPALRVIARRSAFRFKDSDEDLKSIGEALNVDVVVVGSLVERDDQFTVNAEMVRVSDLSQVWGDRYTVAKAQLLDLDQQLTRTIASTLRPEFESAGRAASATRSAEENEAYRLYLRGREYLVGSRREMSKCVELLEAAIDLKPDYALAHATLGYAHIIQARHGTEGQAEAARLARTSVARALELDPDLAEAHAAAGQIAWTQDWDWEKAERELALAMELNPNSLYSSLLYADYLVAMNRLEQAIAEGQRAKLIDPLSSAAAHWLAIAHLAAGNNEEAIAEFQNAIDLNPTWTWGYVKLAKSYAHAGRHEEALATVAIAEQKFAGNASPLARGWMAQTYALTGPEEKTRLAVEDLEREYQQNGIDAMILAELHAMRRDREQTLHWLELCYRERSADAGYLSVIPGLCWPELAEEPRFQALMKKMNLPFRPEGV